MAQNFDPQFLKEVLTRGFSQGEVETLAMDLFYGTQAYDDVTTSGITKTEKVRLVVDYFVQRGETQRLASYLQKNNPNMYNRIASMDYWMKS